MENVFRDIREARAFQDFEIFTLPASRIIGKEVIAPLNHGKNPVPAVWETFTQTDEWKNLLALPRVIPGASIGWTCDYVAATDTFSYLVAMHTPAGTPVPEGMQFRDAPQTLVAMGKWGEEINGIVKRLKKMGFATAWGDPGCGWNAELYFIEELENPPPKPNRASCRNVVPCKK